MIDNDDWCFRIMVFMMHACVCLWAVSMIIEAALWRRRLMTDDVFGRRLMAVVFGDDGLWWWMVMTWLTHGDNCDWCWYLAFDYWDLWLMMTVDGRWWWWLTIWIVVVSAFGEWRAWWSGLATTCVGAVLVYADDDDVNRVWLCLCMPDYYVSDFGWWCCWGWIVGEDDGWRGDCWCIFLTGWSDYTAHYCSCMHGIVADNSWVLMTEG